MKSALYDCSVTHERTTPRHHRFTYGFFLLALDLDEIDEIARRIPFFSRNRRNVCVFRDDDHLPGAASDLRGRVESWLALRGISERPARIVLITSPRLFGYGFNPVSFYVCYRADASPFCAIAEVSNTFREMKPFLLSESDFDGLRFRRRVKKEFYISPFLELDDELDFLIEPPGERLRISVDTWRGSDKMLTAGMSGHRRELTTWSLAGAVMKFPLGGLRIMAAIHWQAFRLWIKRVPHQARPDGAEAQRDLVKRRGEVHS